MFRPLATVRCGLTLLELLIVIAIISLLFQISLPAIEQSRESARKTQCTNNLRQIGLAVHNYEAANRILPPGYTLEPNRHNFVQFILPHIEETPKFDLYHFDANWNNAVNKPVVANEIYLLRCPSAPRKYKYISDYGIYVRIHPDLLKSMTDEGVIFVREDTTGLLRRKQVRSSIITDGLSKTILLCETAGRPDKWELGKRVSVNTISGSRWATPAGRFDIHYRCGGGEMNKGSQLFNCTSKNEIYSFHPDGANFLFGDSSAKFILEDVDPDLFVSLLSAQGND